MPHSPMTPYQGRVGDIEPPLAAGAPVRHILAATAFQPSGWADFHEAKEGTDRCRPDSKR